MISRNLGRARSGSGSGPHKTESPNALRATSKITDRRETRGGGAAIKHQIELQRSEPRFGSSGIIDLVSFFLRQSFSL